MESARRYITPTLQANWNQAISEVIRCLNAGFYDAAWRAVGSFYLILPPTIRKKVKNQYENVEKDYDANATDSASYEEIVGSYNEGLATLKNKVPPLFMEMYERLYDGGYLENKAGPTTKVRGLDRMEEILG